jgi:hypothetical protein
MGIVYLKKTYNREFFKDFKLHSSASDSCNFDSLWKTHSCMFFSQISLYYYLYVLSGIVRKYKQIRDRSLFMAGGGTEEKKVG